MDTLSTVLAGLLLISPAQLDNLESRAGIADKQPYIRYVEDMGIKPLPSLSPVETAQLQPPAVEKVKYTTRSVKITYYCPCYKCNGNNLRRGLWGAYLREGMIASRDLARGTRVKIKNRTYVVEDRCAKKGVIDIFVDKPHRQVYNMGSYRTTVQILQ